MENNIFDDSKDFKSECLPYIVKIKQFCMSRGIPFYMTFATSNNEESTEYITSKQFPPECDLTLKDDKFRKIVLAEHGFDLVLNHVDSFDMADVCDGLLPPMDGAGEIPFSEPIAELAPAKKQRAPRKKKKKESVEEVVETDFSANEIY